jgi:hypothetical protein
MHSMLPEERALALEVLGTAWTRIASADHRGIVESVDAVAADLPRRHRHVSDEYARHVALAAVWYLDRAARRVHDPDRDGHTVAQRESNLALFEIAATPEEMERLFALASALNADDA